VLGPLKEETVTYYDVHLSGNMTVATLSLWYVIQLQHIWSWINIVRVFCACSPLYSFITSVQ